MTPRAASTPLDDVEFLARSDHRVTALDTLARRPQNRADLREMTGVSQSTIGRTLRAFEDRHWVRRDGQYYEATELGAFVAEGIRDLIDRLETELSLRDIWQWLPSETSGFTIEMTADAVVTVAEADNPYRPVNRFRTLLRETDRFRFVRFDLALLEPCKDGLCKRIIEGMQTDIIDPPSVVNHIWSTYPKQFAAALESGNLTLRIHDDLPPFGVGIFDERVAIAGYNPDSGTVKVLIDTGTPEAREWAEAIYRAYRREIPTLTLENDQGATSQAPEP